MPAVIRTFRLILPLLLLLGLPGITMAAGNGSAAAARSVGELHELARLLDAAVLDLNMMLGEEDGAANPARLEGTLKRLDEARAGLPASLAESGTPSDAGAAIATETADFTRLVRENLKAVLQTGAPENAVIDEMMQHRNSARAAIDGVYIELERQAGLAGSPLSEARALALLLGQMSSLYVENASSAYVSNRSQDSSSQTIDQMAGDFSKRLANLLTKARGEEATKRVRGIQTKWHFIEHSMIHYQEKTVPYLVDRYTGVIVSDLMDLARLLGKQG